MKRLLRKELGLDCVHREQIGSLWFAKRDLSDQRSSKLVRSSPPKKFIFPTSCIS